MRGDALRPVHDLKQEMTVVRGYTQLLTEFAQQDGAQLDERIRKALERLDASTTHMTALLDQALRASDGSHTR
jgi:signal transduction histidine kinase